MEKDSKARAVASLKEAKLEITRLRKLKSKSRKLIKKAPKLNFDLRTE